MCLAKSRSMAAKSIEEGQVRLNGDTVKASREVKEGDTLEITSGGVKRKIKVLQIPNRQVSKSAAQELYDVLDEIRVLDEPW
jgi:ribosome-associated heat shock protein Hsp15